MLSVTIDGIDQNIDNDDTESIRLVELLNRGQLTESELQQQISNAMADLTIVQQGMIALQAQLIARLRGQNG